MTWVELALDFRAATGVNIMRRATRKDGARDMEETLGGAARAFAEATRQFERIADTKVAPTERHTNKVIS